MTGRFDLGPASAFVGIRAVDRDGAITGLSAHAGRDFLLVKLPPLDARALEELPEALLSARAELEKLYDASKQEAETRLSSLIKSDPRLAILGAEKVAKRAVRIADKVAEWAVDRTPVGLARRLWPELEGAAFDLLLNRREPE